jgi:hypothetical protein
MTSPEKAFIKLASLLDLHKLEQDDGGSVTEIRHAVLRQLDTVRTRFRSRAGRLFAAQQIEGQIAGFMHGVLAGASSPAELFRAVDALKARALLDEVASGMRMFSTPELAGQASRIACWHLSFRSPIPNSSPRSRSYSKRTMPGWWAVRIRTISTLSPMHCSPTRS